MTWAPVPDGSDFTLANLPLGVVEIDGVRTVATRIGDHVLPLADAVHGHDDVVAQPSLDGLLAAGPDVWRGVREQLLDHLTDRPDHLWSAPPKTEEPFSTPRAWHMLSDALHSFGPDVDEATLKVLAHGLLTPGHAVAFCGYAKIVRHAYGLEAILKGDARWPARVHTPSAPLAQPSPLMRVFTRSRSRV